MYSSICSTRVALIVLALVVLSIPFTSRHSAGNDAAQVGRAVRPDLLAHLTDPGDGWTAFKPEYHTRMIFVSSSQGDDANDGLSSQRPLKTIAKGFALLRNGHSDWLLLRRGDVWYEPIGTIAANAIKNGESESAPTLIASYGAQGARPLLKLGDHRAGLRVALNRPGKAMNIAVVGIHFYDQKGDPKSDEFVKSRVKGGAGISWAAPGENLLIEDCRFEYLSGGPIVGRSPWKGLPDDVLQNVRIRRCVATHAWSSRGHCQGFFVNKVDDLLLEENVLDHNGYCYETGDEPTWFNHNVYITIDCDQVVARGNIVARGSTTGIYCRTNGVLEDNLCIDNCPSLNLGRINKFRPGGVTGRIAGNVVISAAVRDTRQKKGLTGPGIELANVNFDGAVVEHNILIGDPSAGAAALQVGALGVGAHNIVVRSNTVYNWAPAFRCFGTAGNELGKGAVSGVELRDNIFQGVTGYEDDLIQEMRGDAGIQCAGNVCYAPSAETGLGVKGRKRPLPFLDPNRTAATYHKSLGREATREAFLREAHEQSKSNWRQEYTAKAVIAHIRHGFQLVEASDGR